MEAAKGPDNRMVNSAHAIESLRIEVINCDYKYKKAARLYHKGKITKTALDNIRKEVLLETKGLKRVIRAIKKTYPSRKRSRESDDGSDLNESSTDEQDENTAAKVAVAAPMTEAPLNNT